MDKTAIKNFSVWARNALIRSVADRCGLVGVRPDGIQEPLPQSTRDMQFFDAGTGTPAPISGDEIKKRDALVSAIRGKERDSDYKTAYNYMVEQVAYTWFNRLIAIRFMEVNDYLPSRIRVLSSEQAGKLEPDILSTPFDAEFDFTPQERDAVIQWKDRGQKEDMDALFRLLFIKQCDALHEILPNLFQKVDGQDYTELLLNISFTDRDGVVYRLVNDIPESNFDVSQEGQVEIIGWMYQYYISEKHEQVIDPIYSRTISKEDIPAATQIFTTDWVVRYLVDNSLGRYWIERNAESNLSEKLEFLILPKSGEFKQISEAVEPEELRFLDPCMGSGHILVYAFDVLMEIYKECGYTERDAASLIVKNNLFGLDIDERASQLAYFAVMMKARSYDRRFLSKGITPHILSIAESNGIGAIIRTGITDDPKQNTISQYLVETFFNATTLGSIIVVEEKDYDGYMSYLDRCERYGQLTIEDSDWITNTHKRLARLALQAKMLSSKYQIVCTNPPYLNNFESALKEYVHEHYKAYSSDLFIVFIYRNLEFCTSGSYCGYMTPNAWMFLKSYEKLREYLIQNKHISSLIQMAKGAFFKEATVDVCAFIIKNEANKDDGLFIRLDNFKGDMEIQRKKVLDALKNRKECSYLYESDSSKYKKIPGIPIAYWVSEKLLDAFEHGTLLGNIADSKQGLATANNDKFVRTWFEVEYAAIKFDAKNIPEAQESGKKWFPYNKGGEFRKWYGNNDFIVNWENDGYEIRHFFDSKGKLRSRPQNTAYYFRKSASWSDITSGTNAFRYKPFGHIFDITGMSFFSESYFMYLLGLCNTKIIVEVLKIVAPTIHCQCGDVANIPVIFEETACEQIEDTVRKCIDLSAADWDSYETSWDFKRHPLV